jgi:hypothetical protein
MYQTYSSIHPQLHQNQGLGLPPFMTISDILRQIMAFYGTVWNVSLVRILTQLQSLTISYDPPQFGIDLLTDCKLFTLIQKNE